MWKYGLNYPKYQIFDFKKDVIDNYVVNFSYPIFIKPADTVIYSKYNYHKRQVKSPLERMFFLYFWEGVDDTKLCDL